MRSSKFLSFVLGFLSACGLALSAEAEAYTLTVGTEIPLKTDGSQANYVTVSPGEIQGDGYMIGSTKATTVITLNLNNTTAGDYYLQWKGGADGLTAEYTATATLDSDSSVIASGNFHQRNTDTGTSGSKWTPVQIAMLPLKNLPEGAFTVKLAFSSTTGSYAGNYGNFKVLAADSAFMTLPQSGDTVALQTATNNGTLFVSGAVVGKSDIGSTHGNTALDFLINVSEKSTCGMDYYTGASDCSCTLNWCLLDLNGNQVWPASDVATDDVTNTSSWDLTVEHTHDFGTLSAGNYILLATVSNESGKYAGNWGNFTFTATPIVETYYTVTVPTVAHATATVTGATEKETTETATIYSAVSNATVTVTYTADADYELDGTASFTYENIAEDKTVTAPTAKLKQYTITVPEVANTTLAVTSGAETLGTTNGVYTVNIHANVTVTYTADTNYVFDDGTTTKTFSYTDVSQAQEVSLEAPIRQYTVTVPSAANTTVAISTNSVTIGEAAGSYTVLSNSSVTVTYTAVAHYTLSGEATTTITGIAADATITAPTATEDAQWTEGTITTTEEAGDVHIAPDKNTTGKLVINSGTYSTTSHLAIACGENSIGSLALNGGSCAITGDLYLCRHNKNGGKNAQGTLAINGGALAVGGGLYTGWDAGSLSTYVQTAGTVTVGGNFEPSFGGSTTSRVDVTGGTLTIGGNLDPIVWAKAKTDITIGGTAQVTTGDVRFFNGNGESTATLTVSGGLLAANKIYSNTSKADDAATFTLNGGTLQATAAQTDFIENDTTLSVYLTSGTIDTQTYDVTIPAAISGDSMTFTKAGTGTLTFTGTVPSAGTITVPRGCGRVVIPLTTGITAGADTVYTDDATTRTFSFDTATVPYYEEGSVTTVEGDGVYVAPNKNDTGSLIINSGDYTNAADLVIASGDNAVGSMIVNGGTYTIISNLYMCAKGNGTGATSYLTITNGTVNAALYRAGNKVASISYVDISGAGVLNLSDELQLAFGGGTTNIVTVSDQGAINAKSIKLGHYGDNSSALAGAILTQNGGTITLKEDAYFRDKNRSDDSNFFSQSILLKGGVFTCRKIYSNGAAGPYDTFTLAGGTLRANSKQSEFIANADKYLYVYLTSGTIDTQTYDVTIPAAISGDTMAFTKTGSGTLTFTGTIPSSGTITIAKKGGKVVLPGDLSTGWTGEQTVATYDSTAKTTTFSYDAIMRTVTVPTLAGATIVVTADGTAVTAESDGKSYKVEDGATVVVTYTEASGYTLVGGKKVVSLGTVTSDTTMPEGSIPTTEKDRTFNGDYVSGTITGAGRIYTYGNHDAQTQIYTTLDCDLTEFTGTIYVKKDTKIGPNFTGAAQAKWVLEGELYLFGTNANASAELQGKDIAYAGTLSFGDFGLAKMNRIYMYNGEQNVTIEIGAVNSNMTATLNTGIGGHWWSQQPNANASVTMRKVGTGKLTTNLLGARVWEIAAGEVNFVPMTQEATNGTSRLYVTNCNSMTVSSGAKLSGFYGSLPDSGVGAFTLDQLTVPSGATFAPDLGRTWVVGTATLDGCNLELADTGKLTYGTKYTLLTATTSVSATGIKLTGSTDFEVSVSDDGKSLVATFTGYGQYVIANGETLTYAGRVQKVTETTKMDTTLGIVIEAGGKLVVNARAMTLPGTDGTEGNDGTLTLPSVTLPTGKTIEDCVTVIPPAGYHAVFFVTSDGYGYITFEVGEIKPAGLIIIFQ